MACHNTARPKTSDHMNRLVSDPWDVLATNARRPSSRDEFELKVGFLVKHLWTGKLLRITSIDFWGGAHDVGGHELQTEAVDASSCTQNDTLASLLAEAVGEGDDNASHSSNESCMGDEQVLAGDMCTINGPGGCFDRTSLCERCCIYFEPSFVTWSFDSRPSRTWLDANEWQWDGPLRRSHSSCRRCEAHHPTGRVLWGLLRRRFIAKGVADFWSHLAHHPRYVATHAAIAAASIGSIMDAM